MSAVDPLTGAYSMPCPAHGSADVRLSAFRVLEQLPGTAHPAVFGVTFACTCGDEHPALVAHDDLDWAPLGLAAPIGFANLMTARIDPVADEFRSLATARIERGEWPWSFFCHFEERSRPVTPSSFRLVIAGDRSLAVAVRCPACSTVSVNLVSQSHVDVPFAHDPRVAVIPQVFAADTMGTPSELRSLICTAALHERRLDLADA